MRVCLHSGVVRSGVIRLLPGLLLLLGLVACKPAPVAEEDPPRPVRTQLLQPQAIELVGAFPGQVKPKVESPLGFRVGGKLIERTVQRGDTVEAGQLLARLDAEDLQLAEQAAQAQLAAAEVEYARTRGDFQRFSRLRDSGFISSAEFEARKAAYDAAQAAVQQARANLSGRSNQTQYAELRADAPGVVTGIDAEIGQVVAAGQPVVRVAETAVKEVAFQVPEGLVDTITRIGTAQVDLWSGPQALPAKLVEVAASADPVTRAFPARVTLLEAPPAVHLGMSARVRFEQLMSEPMVAVPLSALWRKGDDTRVWLYAPDSGSVHSQPVQVLTVTDTQALLKADFPPAAEVVTAGVHRLAEGMRVSRLGEPQQAPGPVVDGAMLPLAQPAVAAAVR